jgi:NADPH2:quinone reductase
LATQGRLMVLGFSAGQGLPEVKVNRLLLNNVDVRGVGWRAYAMLRPVYMHEQWQALVPLMESGIIKPPIGATYGFEHFGRALVDMEQRRTLGKSVVRVHD